jgi:hypothetical protein
MRAFLSCLIGLILAAGFGADARAQNCGCEAKAPTCCYQNAPPCHHCRHHCHHRRGEDFYPAYPPAGPVMESAPLVRMAPLTVVPATYATETRRLAYADDVTYVRVRETAPRLERSCEGSTERLDVLEDQVTRLTKRVDTLQETLTDHYNILKAIKAKLDGNPMPEER